MSTSTTLKHLAASTATAAVLAAGASTAVLCLTTTTTSAAAAAVPGGTVLRTLHDDEFQTAAGGLRTPTVQPAARIPGHGGNW